MHHEAIKKIILDHYRQYPKMQIQDMVKLIYQNEFAGGHLILNEKDSLRRLQEEMNDGLSDGTDTRGMEKGAFESIGNALYRMYLGAIKDTGIDKKTINRFFINTANSFCGSVQSFEKKLNVLRQCCVQQELPYSTHELEVYLHNYKDKGYPPVRHSEVYRTAYSPAYRVVGKCYRDFFEVFRGIDSLLALPGPVYVAIEGNSGAGKSTLASILGHIYDCNVFHMDHFFLRPEQKTEERLMKPGGNIDYERFSQEVIIGLLSGKEFQYHIYNCKKRILDQRISITPKKLNIIEGCYSMHPAFGDLYHLKIFLQVDQARQSRRILKRNGTLMHQRFLTEWIPLENKYFEAMQIRKKCDFVFDK